MLAESLNELIAQDHPMRVIDGLPIQAAKNKEFLTPSSLLFEILGVSAQKYHIHVLPPMLPIFHDDSSILCHCQLIELR
jgi:hypothetical protein